MAFPVKSKKKNNPGTKQRQVTQIPAFPQISKIKSLFFPPPANVVHWCAMEGRVHAQSDEFGHSWVDTHTHTQKSTNKCLNLLISGEETSVRWSRAGVAVISVSARWQNAIRDHFISSRGGNRVKMGLILRFKPVFKETNYVMSWLLFDFFFHEGNTIFAHV